MDFLSLTAPQEGKIRHALSMDSTVTNKFQMKEFILNVQIDKVEWLKLCKHP